MTTMLFLEITYTAILLLALLIKIVLLLLASVEFVRVAIKIAIMTLVQWTQAVSQILATKVYAQHAQMLLLPSAIS